ncbi:MAG: hypothetical protein IT427_11005 [Pirellulales bacterium]|nr:hypothetical protein [Pirellulales bacterium]
MVVLESIEQLKQRYTDKYVVVDATVPELARFGNAVGLVKTVNMNGRALVEFDQYLNIGWYDIDLGYLKVVPKPEPKKPTEAKHKSPDKAAEKPAPVKPAAAKAATVAPVAGKPSTADILAAARAKKGTSPAATPAAKASPAEAPATQTAPAAKPTSAGKLSTSDILAAARGKGTAPAVPPATKKAEVKPAPTEAAEEPAPVAVAERPVVEAAPIKKVAAGPKPTTIAEKIEYCRRVDAKG